LRRVLGFCGGFSSELSGVFGSGLPAGVFGREMLGCLGGLGQHLVKARCTVMRARLVIGLRVGLGAAVRLRQAFGFRLGRARGWPGSASGDGGLVLARTVASALDAAAPRGPAAPCWIGLDRQSFNAQLAGLRRWADAVLRQHYPGYELRDCWPSHIHAIWELSTVAAEWHHIYGGERPDLARALEFYDRWLPGTMRRIAAITQSCVPNAPYAAVNGDRRRNCPQVEK
jgi:hypothetical protein